MILADERKVDLNAALDREAALAGHLDAALRQVKANWDYAQDKQQRLTIAERRESEAREELLDLSRKLDVFYSRSHGIKNLSAIEDANDKSKALQQRLTVAENRADLLEGLLKSGSSPTYAHCSAVMEALKPAAEPTIEAARQSLSFENQRIQPARFHCLACGEYHEGSGSLPCPKMKPMSGAKP